jgi:nitrous oxide reductase accessory protein NosL
MCKKSAIAVFLFLVFCPGSYAEDTDNLMPGPKDRCPVCGMFVAKYPDFIAVIAFTDGSRDYFDGVKDMMKYYFNLKKYNPAKKVEDIAIIYVTDYYAMKLIDGSNAFYVTGSDVFGPMGNELIPFETMEKAKDFSEDHHGRAIFAFSEITLDAVKGLDTRR